MVKHKIRDFMIIMISVFTLVSRRGYVFIPIQGGTEDVRALRISADDAYDIKLGDQGAMNAETIEVLYSDGSTKMRSIASLAADKTIFEKSGITEDVLLKEGGAEAYTDIFVYDIIEMSITTWRNSNEPFAVSGRTFRRNLTTISCKFVSKVT